MRVLIDDGRDVYFKGFNGNAPISVTDEVYHDDIETSSLQALQIIFEACADIMIKNNRVITKNLKKYPKKFRKCMIILTICKISF